MIEPPVVLPLDELTACQQLVNAWVDVHLSTLIVVGVLAVIGVVTTIGFVMNVFVGLAERVLRKWHTTPSEGGS